MGVVLWYLYSVSVSACPRGTVVIHCTAERIACLAARPQRFGVELQVPAACQYILVNYMHIQRIISRAGTEGLTVSSLICDRWLMLGLKTLSSSCCLNH